jgi:glyceraldehyde-3-phosphate dehydrogenase/erythrose-4-phosphate dehydrogenase
MFRVVERRRGEEERRSDVTSESRDQRVRQDRPQRRAAYEAVATSSSSPSDITDERTLAYQLGTTPSSGDFGDIEERDGAIAVDGTEIKILAERDPQPSWADLGVDVGSSRRAFTKRDDAAKHPRRAPEVITSAPRPIRRDRGTGGQFR